MKKIAILGFDGLSPGIVEPMLKNGSLPNLAALKKQGSYKRLSTTNPSQSPVAWAGFATGKNPGKTGIFDFVIRDPSTYKLNLSLSNIKDGKPERVIQSKRFWDYTSEKNIPTVVLRCPLTFPPDKIHGRMLSGMGVPDVLGTEGVSEFYTKDNPAPFKALPQKNGVVIGYESNRFELKKGEWSGWKETASGLIKFYLVETRPGLKLYASPVCFNPKKPSYQISYPKGYAKDIAEHIGLFNTQGMPLDTKAVNKGWLPEDAFLAEADDVFKKERAMLDFELDRFKGGVLFAYFDFPDVIQHMFWGRSDAGRLMKRWYKKMDGILGDTIKKLGKEDTVIVLSDHGFDVYKRAAHVNSWLRANGYLRLKEPGMKKGTELLKDVDWPKTKAYAIGFGAIYINQRGREGGGIVGIGEETGSLKKEISQKLKEWMDEEYKKPVINRVYAREEIFRGEYSNECPDLYIGFNIGYRASSETAMGSVPEALIEDNVKKWSGDHLFDPDLIPGVIFSSKKILKKDPSIYDITPTILKACGFSRDRLRRLDLDGESLF